MRKDVRSFMSRTRQPVRGAARVHSDEVGHGLSAVRSLWRYVCRVRSLRNAVAVLLVKGVIAEESSASAKLAVSREYHMKPSHVAILVLR